MKRRIGLLLLIFASVAMAGVKPRLPDSAELQLMLKKLSVVGGALYIAAHPDDENTAMLAYLSQGRLVRAAYLSLTRGDGGQNLIGSEQGELLGLIRTQELLAARDLDGSQQFFSRAIDFGYTKSPQESLEFWGRENILSDVVWVIRRFRPDVILCRFPTSGGGHGQHIASAILAEEAFHAAADPKRFPEQLRHVAPWKPGRILWNYYSWAAPPSETEAAAMVKVDVGEYNPVLGFSYSELAGVSRSMHKSQGFGDSEDRGPQPNYFRLVAGDPAKSDLFEGIDLSWKRIAGSEAIARALDQATRAFRPDHPEASLPDLMRAYELMKAFPANPWVEDKKAEVLRTIQACSGLWLEAIATEDSGTPGSGQKITATAINRSAFEWNLVSVTIGGANTIEVNQPLADNQPVSRPIEFQIPDSAGYSQPYWLNGVEERRIVRVTDQQQIGDPEGPAPFSVRFTLSSGEHTVEFIVPVLSRHVDPVRGEVYRRFVVVPKVAVNLRQQVVMFPATESKEIGVELRSGAPQVSGEVRLSLPAGWTASPVSVPFSFNRKNQTSVVRFSVTPGNDAMSGEFGAVAVVNGKSIDRGLITIDYLHIPYQTVFPPARGKLVRLDVKRGGERIAYIMGSGDSIPDSLRQVGYQVTLLPPDTLATTDLSRFDAVILGIRAYNTVPELASVQSRLMEYVKNGGTLVAQYNTLEEFGLESLGPYPFRVSRDRVAVEDAPVTILAPEHPVLNDPNVITANDFNGWVQERGLYFPGEWDSQYQTVIASNDPGESPKAGGILYAKYGKGVYIYTSYSWFRELPAGVPGAVRLFVNLISAKQ